jgi:hypothetical protein
MKLSQCPFCKDKISDNHSCASSKHKFSIRTLTDEEFLGEKA